MTRYELIDEEFLEDLLLEFPDTLRDVIDPQSILDLDKVIPVYNLNSVLALEFELVEHGTLALNTGIEFNEGYGVLATYATGNHTALDYEMHNGTTFVDIEDGSSGAPLAPANSLWLWLPSPMISFADSAIAGRFRLYASGAEVTVLKYIQVKVQIAS